MDTSKNIYENFAQTAKQRGDHPAVCFLGTWYSYRKIQALAENLASALTELGISAGQRVMLYIPNSIQWVVSWLGLQKIGAVCVPITPIYTPP